MQGARCILSGVRFRSCREASAVFESEDNYLVPNNGTLKQEIDNRSRLGKEVHLASKVVPVTPLIYDLILVRERIPASVHDHNLASKSNRLREQLFRWASIPLTTSSSLVDDLCERIVVFTPALLRKSTP